MFFSGFDELDFCFAGAANGSKVLFSCLPRLVVLHFINVFRMLGHFLVDIWRLVFLSRLESICSAGFFISISPIPSLSHYVTIQTKIYDEEQGEI